MAQEDLDHWYDEEKAKRVGINRDNLCGCHWCRGHIDITQCANAPKGMVAQWPGVNPPIYISAKCVQASVTPEQPKMNSTYGTQTGFNCMTCNNRNDQALANVAPSTQHPQGAYLCYNCR